MIAFVEAAPFIDLHGEHFLVTFRSGDEDIQLMLTTKAFRLLNRLCAVRTLDRSDRDAAAQERVVQFPTKKRPKRTP